MFVCGEDAKIRMWRKRLSGKVESKSAVGLRDMWTVRI